MVWLLLVAVDETQGDVRKDDGANVVGVPSVRHVAAACDGRAFERTDDRKTVAGEAVRINPGMCTHCFAAGR